VSDAAGHLSKFRAPCAARAESEAGEGILSFRGAPKSLLTVLNGLFASPCSIMLPVFSSIDYNFVR
jgi:hypothetical protein